MTNATAFIVRAMTTADETAWAGMRAALWPEENAREHRAAILSMHGHDNAWAFIAETKSDRQPAGFAELAIRPYANGCDSQPVPFLEGIWIAEAFRRQGVGALFINHITAFVIARGFREIGSDTPLDNHVSQDAHRGWGFSETERVVYFRKRLEP